VSVGEYMWWFVRHCLEECSHYENVKNVKIEEEKKGKKKPMKMPKRMWM